jgi:hypothetical protein
MTVIPIYIYVDTVIKVSKKEVALKTVPLPLYSIDLSEIIRLQEFRPLRYLQQKGSL